MDLGIGCLIRPDPEVLAERLFSDRLAAFVPVGHPLTRRRSLRFGDLAAQPLILTGQDTSVRQRIERTLADERLPIQIAQEVTYMSTAIGMVAAGLGVAVLPESALTAHPDGRVQAVAIRDPVLTRDIAILTRAGRSRSPAADQFVAALRQVARRAQTATRATRKPMWSERRSGS